MVIFNTVDSYLTIWNFVSVAFKHSWWLFFLEFLPFETVFLLPSLAEDDLELLILQLLPTHTWDFGCASPEYYVVLDIRPQGFKHVRQALYNWAPSNDLRGSPYVILFSFILSNFPYILPPKFRMLQSLVSKYTL